MAIVAWWFIIRPRERSLGTESILQIDANVFLSYRRRDSAYITGRIRKELSAALGDENLFMDTDSIPLGSDFLEEIRAFLEKADVMLVVIGPMWEGRKEDGSTRIHEDKDHVRLEVETALGL
ncbi:MAG TPA: toll/interleukin-1 receptor domain-containing protein, partial [Haloferula sp.]